MSTELRKRNGRWELVGVSDARDLVPVARPQSARQARPKPAAKPAAKRPSGSARPKPAAKRPSGSARPKPVARRKAGQQSFLSSLLSIFGHIETKKARTATASGRQLGLGVVGAADNAARMGYSFYQRQVKKRPKADPSSGVVGERLDRLVDTGYRAFGAKPPSKMTQPERGRDQFRRALTTNLLLTPVTPQFGFLRGVPTIQLGAQFAANEILSNYLDDQTGGNIINTINSAWGLKLPGAVDVGSDDMIDAANKSLLPNSALSLTAGSALGLTPKVLDAGARAGANRFPNIRRNIRAGRAVQQETAERARQQAAGLTRETEGGIVFTPEAQQPPPPLDMEEWVQGFKARERERNAAAAGATPQPQPRQIPTIDATAETFGKAQPAPLPSANPPKDPWMDDEQYQAWLRQNALAEAWLRQNASAEIVPVAPPAARPPAELPRQPLPPQDDLRGEGLADPWGMGPDPNSPVQQELGRKAGAAPPSRSEQAADPEVEIEVDPEVDSDGFPVYSPDLPESTAVGRTLRDMSDREIITALEAQGPVVERINQIVESRGEFPVSRAPDARMVMAPASSLAEDYLAGLRGTLNGMEEWQLAGLFDVETNPDLFLRAQALTGADDMGQLSKTDMLDTIDALSQEGQAPLVGRLTDDRTMPVDQIAVAPKALQYKDNVDDQGRQVGNSLEGVSRWNPNAEGAVAVWRDAAGELGQPGQFYVADGHNRLAKSRELGIPSLPVREIVAPNAAAARLQAADANISAGQGTVFDAAKMARELGMKSEADAARLGKPGASGFWRDGIALAQLPEDVFTGVINSPALLRKGVIIGRSGVDEPTMRSAWRWLTENPDATEGRLRGMLDMSRTAPRNPSSEGRQGTILEGTPWGEVFNAGMLAKADLAEAVKAMFNKEKRLFGSAGKNADELSRVGAVNSQAASGIASEASRAKAVFDELWFTDGPISRLMDEGAERVAAGEKAATVAQGLKNRLVAAVKTELGQSPAPVPATDVVQGDMLSAAGEASQPPIRLTPDEREAAEIRLIRESIANGEVRPADAPMPELPEPSTVRLNEVADAPPAPGSKEAQATADELRLAVEHARADAALRADALQEAKDASDYELLTFQQKQEQGLGAGLGEARTPEAPVAAAEQFRLPPELSRSSPRYGTAQLAFASDLDRTAYILFNDTLKPSKAAPKFRAAVEAAGLDVQSIVRHGKKVKAEIKRLAGGGAAPQKSTETIEIPSQPFVQGGAAALQPPPARPERLRVLRRSGLQPDPARVEALRKSLDLLNAERRAKLDKELPRLMKELRRTVGDDVTIKIENGYKQTDGAAAWGAAPGEVVDVEGMYELHNDTITLYRQSKQLSELLDGQVLELKVQNVVRTAFHEAFHRIVRLAMTDNDMDILQSRMSRFKVAKAMDDWGPERATIAFDETVTEAFARYAAAKYSGQDPTKAIFKMATGVRDRDLSTPQAKAAYKIAEGIAVSLNKVYDFVERVVNLFQGRGFESVASVFKRAQEGQMSQTNWRLEMSPVFAEFDDPAGWLRFMRTWKWENENVFGREFGTTFAEPPSKASVQRLEKQIRANDDQIAEIRRKAQKDGC